ncbi:MAG: Ubiquinone biosynthesis protein UbiA [uncultured Aureispira sp.]|uniref:Ubiquinone biosynthesis protein UbiA n=1 Tax=uncultured Aureispira sp. TaxID=1331704 RepID=A0A6S6TG73_9BACT|nr:MAG: Ubiquinone biosynthesis protein UbiA [uncultured Aureispira sp.]
MQYNPDQAALKPLINALFRLIRIPNLIIIGMTLGLLYSNAETPSLDGFSFAILVLGTICIAAAGNVINDILDVEIDWINKKDRVVVGVLISLKSAWGLYFFLNIAALVGAIYGRSIDLFSFFLGAIILLYFYSTLWKRQALIGNVVVAFLCTWVVFEFWWFSYASLTDYWQGILLAYMIFAFLSTLARELVKDVEDMEGDKLQGCQTVAIQKGLPFVKKIILILLRFLLVLLIVEAYFLYTYSAYLAFVYLITALVVPLFYMLRIVHQAEKTADFSRISRLLKAYMLLGLLLLLLV